KVGHKATGITYYIRSAPGIGTTLDSSTGSILPFGLGGQPKLVYELSSPALLVIVLKLCPPIAKGLGLFPGDSYYRIVAIGIVPKIVVVHRFVVRVLKILDPYGSIRI